MRWLKGVLGAGRAPAADAALPEDWLRAGYDCESAGNAAGAERSYRRALEHERTHAEAHYFLGRIAEWDRRHDEAIVHFQTAADLRPGEATYLYELGNALRAAMRHEESLEAFRHCLALLPHCVDARINHAVALIELDRREEARIELERLRRLLPELPEIHFNLGGIYREYARIDEAIAAYRRVQELRPGDAPTHSNLLMMLHYSTEHDARSIFAEHRRFGEVFSRRYIAPRPDRTWPRRLRIGYVSPDFRSHVVTYFFEPILANHDRARFEVFCYYTHPEKDVATERLRGHAEHWLDCEDLREEELAERIRADRVDILVDLAGHTGHNALAVLAMKPAPVQASYLGYPDTTGLGAVDFRITDAYADPPGESDRLSVERLLRLPASYFCYRPAARTPDVGPLPAGAARTVTFGCFNNFHKISAPFLDAVARVLRAVPGSRFLLKGRPLSIPEVARSVRDRFERCGIGPDRIELRAWEDGFKDHLAIYGAVDIALDSFPYNGATTTCEALWMGVPVVTVVGDRHAARTGSSLLNAVGLSELVARDIDEYVAICVRLAGDMERLETIRRALRDRMRRSPLMDETGFTRALELCYVEMWEKTVMLGPASPATQDGAPLAALLERARRLRDAGDLAETEAACAEILRRQPDHLEALTVLWDLGFDAGRPGIAIDWLLKGIAANGEVAAFHHMLGCALQAQRKGPDAAAAFRRALELDSTLARAHSNLGCLLEAEGALEEAVRCYRKAIAANPDLVEALYNLGNACKRLGDPDQAISHIARALALEPRHADWHCNLGELQLEQMHLDEAIASFEAAREIDPDYELARTSLGIALTAAGRLDEAAAAFGKALELKPRNANAEAWLLLLLHCRGGDDAQTVSGKHLEWAHRYPRGLVRMTDHPRRGSGAGRRLNLGYLLPDLRRRPIASFIEPVLACHDRSAFNVYCYAGSGSDDDATRRLRGVCEQWRDLSATTDHDAAHRIRADGIDVLVDLAGHHPGGRMMVLARKPAAVQVSWLGYPSTTGLEAIDYRLSDAVADPEGETERFHTERLVRLPHGFLCYSPVPGGAEPGEPPEPGRVVFGSFNNLAKLAPRMVALWAELLSTMPESRLVLKNHGLTAESARRALREQFQARGIAAERLDLLAASHSYFEHLATYCDIDVALDVFPYNGTVTTCEALWMGVPVVTLCGKVHLARVGASILGILGLSDLVASAPQEYVRIARQLAIDVERRRVLRSEMRARMRASPLLDAPAFTRSLEAAYRQIWAGVDTDARAARERSTGTDDD